MMEKIQRRAIKLVTELTNVSYEERLAALGLKRWKIEGKEGT